ncbi:hypothetical protein SARC_08407 [Sphaeroforma arctica JP610]|uniref:Uncharacterized protein n=1 Tax=Sphaeroforma arctica JP610 TaxID=667725 RepID=A0A0L0FR02_9EUKA|nr:hypothetical protein SARC_08407 [Sphaeroforma arctica JP610]KNC79195.1 hypothetical protein SARC_08407 [Sphaeroforma arctica JP610]|eukprot:XP_014153097.1 hypothetical protein SARC_08407 [Sphaeroforma arctica JP610]
MSSPRQNRRQQHLNPERRKEDDIDRRVTRRHQSNPDRINQKPEKDPDEQYQASQEARHHSETNLAYKRMTLYSTPSLWELPTRVRIKTGPILANM